MGTRFFCSKRPHRIKKNKGIELEVRKITRNPAGKPRRNWVQKIQENKRKSNTQGGSITPMSDNLKRLNTAEDFLEWAERRGAQIKNLGGGYHMIVKNHEGVRVKDSGVRGEMLSHAEVQRIKIAFARMKIGRF